MKKVNLKSLILAYKMARDNEQMHFHKMLAQNHDFDDYHPEFNKTYRVVINDFANEKHRLFNELIAFAEQIDN